ncbi:ankyrin repeat domain-containing protein [Aggregatimonas sangjinii]|uniref:Ankyrin repeat domain-containing protein n=1 Tax=Aggregatimonas sangjinii TaxID=2583587 RepID=A0A5B7SR95_9FLAO|nr:ankyrin repeat domain-containing protein [Aggregatimonas sangjinii]QCW99878.1 ankyrin repeat domain-containing protein [Aggregatimonas sangjinii]
MPLIETLDGEGLQLSRTSIKYISPSGESYFAECEPVVSSDYDMAVYVDTLCDEDEICIKDKNVINDIFYKIKILGKRIGAKLKFFRDYGDVFEPNHIHKSKNYIPNNQRYNRLEETIEKSNISEFERVLIENPSLYLTERYGFNNESLMHYLAKKGKVSFCKLLLEKGAICDELGLNNETPLVRASSNGHLDIVKLLTAHGADINGNPKGLATPLIAAAAMGHEEVVFYLLESGADKTIRDKDLGQTAEEIAKNMYQNSIAEIINSF